MSAVKISAADVKKLRDITGAGMMDCKKALVEAEGDTDKAIEILRKKGQKLSAKRADREAKEGAVVAVVSNDHTKGVIVKLSCETDFVAKNDDFVALTRKFADIALANAPASTAELSAYELLEAAQVAPYIHMGNKAAVLVGLNKADANFYDAGRDVAMQVAAMRPVALDKDGVDESIIQKEIEIGKEQARQAGKPDAILEKIAMGKLNKFFKENTLLNQQFVKDNKKSVADYLKTFDGELTVTDFKHVTLG